MEPRLSIYGRTKDEWDKLARWAINHDVGILLLVDAFIVFKGVVPKCALDDPNSPPL